MMFSRPENGLLAAAMAPKTGDKAAWAPLVKRGAEDLTAAVMKGTKMPGQLGASKVTVQSLKVVEVRGDTNIVMIRGAIPGPRNGYVVIKKAVKKK